MLNRNDWTILLKFLGSPLLTIINKNTKKLDVNSPEALTTVNCRHFAITCFLIVLSVNTLYFYIMSINIVFENVNWLCQSVR